MDASQALRSAIERKGLTNVAFARDIGASVTMLSLWLNGHFRPGTTFATRIQEATGIPATDWARPVPTRPPTRTVKDQDRKVKVTPRRRRVA